MSGTSYLIPRPSHWATVLPSQNPAEILFERRQKLLFSKWPARTLVENRISTSTCSTRSGSPTCRGAISAASAVPAICATIRKWMDLLTSLGTEQQIRASSDHLDVFRHP
jgi:hypothetical protein